MSGRRCAPCGGWWSEDTECHGFEVLHGGGEKELIARAGKTAQPHALEAVVNLQVGKAHLDAFALVARLEECQSRRSSSSTGDSIAYRSLRPLPCSTRNSMRSLSMSDTFSDATSDTRRPAP